MQRRRVDVAYVLILDDAREHVLLVQDNGYWTLPGGMREVGEMLEQTAVREVKEETGFDVTLGGDHPHISAVRAVKHGLAMPRLIVFGWLLLNLTGGSTNKRQQIDA